ncbi:MAG: hypothetical protein KAW17_11245 [Candidatus Eisenbacteria sp.]|nr:hypothetical protein [Candidatus Eisenbacteria bacterium]
MANPDQFRRRVESAGAIAVALLFVLLYARSADPGPLRFVLAVVTLLFLPGYLLGRLLWHSSRWSFVHWFSIAVSLSLAVGCFAAWILYLLHADSGYLLWTLVGVVVLLSTAGLAGAGPNPVPSLHRRTPPGAPTECQGRIWLILLTVLAIAVASMLALSPARIGYIEDALVHMATSKAILETGKIIPPDLLLYGMDHPGEDPRVALIHSVVAALGQGSGLDMYTVWSWLLSFFVPFWIASFFTFTNAILRGYSRSVLATLLFVLLYGGQGTWSDILRDVFYPSRIGMCVFWTGLLLMLDHLRWRDRDTFWLATLLLPVAAMIHVTPFLNYWISLASLAVFLGIFGNRKRWAAIQAGKALGVGTLLAAPYLLTRYLTSFDVVNPIHQIPQRVLFLDGGWILPLPTEVIAWFGWAGILAFPLGVALFRQARDDEGRMLLFGNTVVALALLSIPPVFTLAFRTVNFLAIRFVQLVPYITILTLFLLQTPGKIREGRRPAVRGVAFVILFLLLAVPGALKHLSVHLGPFVDPSVVNENPTEIIPALRELDALAPASEIVLSDPFTSYAILAFTHHRPMAVPVSHSSPSDSLSVTRTHAATLALDPGIPLSEALASMRRYGVSYIILNHTFRKSHNGYAFSIDPDRFAAQKEHFDAHPEYFEAVAALDSVYIYRLRPGAALETGTSETAPGAVKPCRDLPKPGGPAIFYDTFELVGAKVLSDRVARGDELGIEWCWKRTRGGELDSDYWIYIRFDRDYDRGILWQPAYSKPYRKILERLRGERYRFRADYPMARYAPLLALPTAGVTTSDSMRVAVPKDVAPGRYQVKISLNPKLVHANIHIRDFLRDDDMFDGVPIGWVEVE